MSTNLETANAIVKKYTNWSAAGGLIPLPLLDMAVISGIQGKMLYELSKVYEVPFQATWVKGLVGTLLGSAVPTVATAGVLGMGVKAIPVVGTAIGVLTMPALAYAATYAVGKVFVQHFESGGTFLDFDPEAVREHFRAEFESGRKAKATTV